MAQNNDQKQLVIMIKINKNTLAFLQKDKTNLSIK